MDELKKALNEKGLKFSTLPEKGRCLFAARDFSPGLSRKMLPFFFFIFDNLFELLQLLILIVSSCRGSDIE